MKVDQLAPNEQQVAIKAIDCTKDTNTSQLNITMPTNKANTGGPVEVLSLAVGAKVMLTVNIDVSDGLVNGARGGKVTVILVKFDHPRVGVSAMQRSHYRQEHPQAIPISRHVRIGKNKTAEVSRTQFLFVLGHYYPQGPSMKGGRFMPGQAYVAFSRVRSLDCLFIKNFDPSGIKTSPAVVAEMERLSSNCLPPQPVPQVLSLPQDDWIKIGHLNVHSFLAKAQDVQLDKCIESTDIMCFTETFLTPQQMITSMLLHGEAAQVYRLDCVTEDTQDFRKGGITIVCCTSFHPEEVNISHPAQLEVKTAQSIGKIYVAVIYRRPQLPSNAFLSHLNNYMSCIPHGQFPTVEISTKIC